MTTLYGNFEKVKLLLEITNHRTISSILFQRPILFQLELDKLKVIFGAALRIAANNCFHGYNFLTAVMET